VQTVAAPAVITSVELENIRNIITIDPGSDYGTQGEYVSGLTQPGVPISVFDVDGGRKWITGLTANSDYVFRFKRTYFFNRATNTLTTVTSPYTNFAFHTPTLEQARPSTPVLSLGAVTATTVDITWAPSTDNASVAQKISYTYTLNGVQSGANCAQVYGSCFGATGLQLARPAPGQTIRVTVTATDDVGNNSLPSAEFVYTAP
jgi:hypothetical protein